MSIKVGLVGLPNVGKSTFFNVLTRGSAAAANYPFCTIEPNIGSLIIEDERIDMLASVDNPANIVRETVQVVDIAGLVKGASEGEGLGNKFLANIREVDMILHVVRCFSNDDIIHVNGAVDPFSDMDIIETELRIKDLDTVNNRIEKVQKLSRSGDKKANIELQFLLLLKQSLSGEGSIRDIVNDDNEETILRSLQLLSSKPVLFIFNIDSYACIDDSEICAGIKERFSPSDYIFLPIKNVSDMIEMMDFGDDLSQSEEYMCWLSSLKELSRKIYDKLGFISFFTSGEDETRAWTIKDGTGAQKAAGVIHSDFEKKFVKAEVSSFDDYYKNKKEGLKNNPRVEGRDYIVKDGDVIFFKIGQ